MFKVMMPEPAADRKRPTRDTQLEARARVAEHKAAQAITRKALELGLAVDEEDAKTLFDVGFAHYCAHLASVYGGSR